MFSVIYKIYSMALILPIMLALCSILSGTYYAQNYTGKIDGITSIFSNVEVAKNINFV